MKNRPIHENLDTSFVNLSALVKYLRRRQFVGNVRVELSGYDADIDLTAENQINVREQDRITGRIGEGEEALQRILIRAREPGGIIHVYQKVEETENSVVEKKEQTVKANELNNQKTPNPPVQNETAKIISSDKPPIAETLPKAGLKLPKFPFELTNRVENKAKQSEISPQEWQTLLGLTAEILNTVDKTLAESNLDFPSAFEKARLEISEDYPFLNPASGVFDYKNGKISMDEQISATLFVVSINETLRRIFEKLGNNPKFAEVHRAVMQRIIVLIRQRKPLYDKFSITPELEKIVGV
ncbi:hypothetical protein BH20ACI1_BH20ACI1_32570 [soil metagenome]